jgi:hypothetical protein
LSSGPTCWQVALLEHANWPVTDLNSATVLAVKGDKSYEEQPHITCTQIDPRLGSRNRGVASFATHSELGQSPSPATKEGSQNGASLRDGRHDFDFALGNWKFHLKELDHPLAGSNIWIELDGHSSCQKIWDGADLDQVEACSADRKTHIHGLTLRLYNPESHQWSLYWGNAAKGVLSLPAVVGEFKNGRGEFYDQEDYNGRMILVRYAWSDITPTSAHFEQAFSTTAERRGKRTGSLIRLARNRRAPCDQKNVLAMTRQGRGSSSGSGTRFVPEYATTTFLSRLM